MTAFEVVTGKINKKKNFMLYGTPGIGKTTLAAGAKKSIIADCEDGSSHLDCARVIIKTWKELLNFITWVADQPDYEVVVFDSYTKIEKLMADQVCEDNGWPNLEKPGYGKGYEVLKTYALKLIAGLEYLNKKGKTTITIAHQKIRTVSDPLSESYDRYEPDIHKTTMTTFYAFMDGIFFYRWKAMIKETEKGDRYIAKSSGDRELHTVERTAFLAKSRVQCDNCIVNPKEDFYDNVI